MLPQAEIEVISQVITSRFQEARERYNLSWERPTFSFDVKGTTAGKAHLSANRVMINEGLYVRNKEDFINGTLPHEVAHLAAFRAFNDRGHGLGWKRVMRDFGLEPQRCHSYDVSEVRTKSVKRFYYNCSCGKPMPVSTTIHNRIIERIKKGGSSGYSCRKCRSPIIYSGRWEFV